LTSTEKKQMADVVTFTPEQFNELLKAFKVGGEKKPGLGRGKEFVVPGLGCGDGGCAGMAPGVYEMLALGSPRLALAKALGVRLVPYYFNIRAPFPNVATTDVSDVGADVKIVQDTLISGVVVRIFNQSNTANQNIQQAESDFFYTFQSGIEATLDVKGAPRPSLVPQFTPLANIADAFNGDAHIQNGFVLTYQQQLQASFHASITLPYAPIEVVLTFQAVTPDNEMFVQMTNAQAFEGLVECGFDCDEAYIERVLSTCR
jgi:hypothetical protein